MAERLRRSVVTCVLCRPIQRSGGSSRVAPELGRTHPSRTGSGRTTKGPQAGGPVPRYPDLPRSRRRPGAALGERGITDRGSGRRAPYSPQSASFKRQHDTRDNRRYGTVTARSKNTYTYTAPQQSTPPESCRLDVCIHVTRSGRWPSCRILPIQSVDHGREGGRGRIPPSSATPKGTAPETSRRRGEAAAAVAQGAALQWRRLAWLCRSRRLAGRP